MLKFSVKGSGVRYDLCLTGKYNILCGLSGTGKTRLANLLFIRQTSRDLVTYNGPGNIYTDYNINAIKVVREIQNQSGSVFVIDEESDLFETSLQEIKESNNYFIIMSREGFAQLPYGIDNIFEFVKTKFGYSMELKYKQEDLMFPSYKWFKSNIVTEDAGTGYNLVQRVFGDDGYGYRVLSAQGKDKFKSFLKTCNYKDEYMIFVIDLCGIGGASKSIFNILDNHPNIAVTHAKSFEWCLLGHPMFKSKEVRDSITLEQLVKFDSEEVMYEALVNNRMLQFYGVGYKKIANWTFFLNLVCNGYAYRGTTRVNAVAFAKDDLWLYPEIPRSGEVSTKPSEDKESSKSIKTMNLYG